MSSSLKQHVGVSRAMLCKTDQALPLQSLCLPVSEKMGLNHFPGNLRNISLELWVSPWSLETQPIHSQSKPLNNEKDTRLELSMKFIPSRSVIHCGTTECIFQTNSEPTIPVIFGHLQEPNLFSYQSSPVL